MDYEKMEEDALIIEEIGSMMTTDSNTELYKGEVMESEDIEVEELNAEGAEKNPAVNDFLNSDYGSHEEQVIKKMMAAAAIAYGSEDSPEEVASQADASAVSIKTAYKVSTGEIDITESTEILIDQAAARLDTFIQKKLDMEWVGEKIVDVVTTAYPPVAQLKPYVKAVMKRAEPMVRKAITTGIKAVASYAKTTVKTISSKVKNLAKALLA
ncbi:MAG: hypothetical protein K2K98_02365 [Muribaculaceae bacterium]|nr:hypothetical protein [Muribaculaceae bacterium]